MKQSQCYGLWMVASLILSACGGADRGDFQPGVTDSCRAQPAFLAKSGLAQPIALDSRQQGYQGLRLVSTRDGRSWQHPSWDDAGNVGAFARDRQGNLYVAPIPKVHVTADVLKLTNSLYRIDATSGEMSLFMEMPTAQAPSQSNPFGILGLFYDCDTDSLYVSSVAGSTPEQALGRVYQVSVQDKRILSQLEQTDAFGLATFNGVKHKRLYMGQARSPDVYSVALDAKGRFTADARYEFSLAALEGGNTSSVRKLAVQREKDGQYLLVAKEQEFGFRLMADNNHDKRMYRFMYQPSGDGWRYVGAVAEQGE